MRSSADDGAARMTEQDQAESFARAVRAMRPGNALAADGESGRQPFGMKYGGPVPVRPGSALGVPVCRELFGAQLGSRHLDLAARWLRERERGYYTIGSSGHEGNAGVAAALRVTDPALLHYRSGAFYLTRACQADRSPAALQGGRRDVLLGLVAAAAEPTARTWPTSTTPRPRPRRTSGSAGRRPSCTCR